MTADYESLIRPIPDFPQPGILFRDITPLLGDSEALRAVVQDLAAPFREQRIDRVAGIEARGFLFGAPLAIELGAGFVPMRKEGKLPHETFSARYELEYGDAAIELHQDGLQPGDNVLLVDDVLATGGTMAAAVELVQQTGANVAGILTLIELTALNGRARLPDHDVVALIRY